jgi:hypothetical protein
VKPHSWFEDPPPERWFAEEEPAPGSGARPRPYAAEIEPATEDLGALSFPPEPEPDAAVAPLPGSGGEVEFDPLAFVRGVTVGLGSAGVLRAGRARDRGLAAGVGLVGVAVMKREGYPPAVAAVVVVVVLLVLGFVFAWLLEAGTRDRAACAAAVVHAAGAAPTTSAAGPCAS